MVDTAVAGFYRFLNSLGYRHPVHPILVHLVIGLAVGAFIFVLIGRLWRRQGVTLSAWHCLILAFFTLIPTMLLGWMDWQHFYAGAWVVPIKAKLVLSLVLLALLGVGILAGRGVERTSNALLIICALCVLDTVGLGYFGGDLVFGASPSGAPSSAVPAEAGAGERAFRTLCSSCHPGGGNTLDPDEPVRGSHTLVDFKTFLSWIRNPDSPMPAFPESRISDQQSRELYEYVKREFGKE